MEAPNVPRRKIFLGALMVGIVAGTILSARYLQQTRLDTGLLSAIRRGDSEGAIEMVAEGADANASEWIGPPWAPLQGFAAWLHGRSSRSRGFFAPALYLVFTTRMRHEGMRATGGSVSRDTWDAPADAGEFRLIKLLLDHGANPNAHPSRTGPLLMAIRLNQFRTVRLLLAHHADPNAADESNFRPLMIAGPEVTRLLIASGARVDLPGNHGLTPLMAAAAEQSTASAARIGLLLSAGANPNARDTYGQTPLMHAATVAAARVLLEHGANVNATTTSGATALMMDCANYSEPGLPAFLIQHGARVTVTDHSGKSALDYARARGRVNLVRMLMVASSREHK